MDNRDFPYIQKLVFEFSGIVLELGKEYLVDVRLIPLARREGFVSLHDLFEKLRNSPFNNLHYKVVEAITTNETTFFRDVPPFEILKNFVLPTIIAKRSSEKLLNIWSAASSSGQEPYSIAMIIRTHFPELLYWKINFIASDISKNMIERAQKGIYSQLDISRGLPQEYLQRYFKKKGTEWEIDNEIIKMVDFREINLVKPWPFLPAIDILFIRNVMIYFNMETKIEIFSNIRRVLRQDGFLFLGGAETNINIDDNFERAQLEKGWCYKLKNGG